MQSEQQKGNKLKEWILLNLNLSSRRTLLVCSLKWLHFRASMMFISEHSKCLTIGKWIEGSKLWLLVMCPAFNVECYIRIKGGLCWDRWLCISVSALFRKYRTLAFIHGCLSCVHFYLLCVLLWNNGLPATMQLWNKNIMTTVPACSAEKLPLSVV